MVCWNPLDEQNPEMSLGVPFDQVFMKKTKKTSSCKLQKIARTGAYFRHSHLEMAVTIWNLFFQYLKLNGFSFCKNTPKIPQFASLIRHLPHFYLQYSIGQLVVAQISTVHCSFQFKIGIET